MRRRRRRIGRERPDRGQAVLEFALVLPIMLLVFVGLADLGRVYDAVIRTESSAREAADYGSFRWYYWQAANVPKTEAEMVRRACTAMLGLSDYEGAADGSTCTNPVIDISVEGHHPKCDIPLTDNPDPSCIVHVRSTFTFHTVLRLPFAPTTLTITRDSRYATGWENMP